MKPGGNIGGSRVGLVLVSPRGDMSTYSFKLYFSNTNNTMEYKALLFGLQEAKMKGVKQLRVRGDVELIVKQEREKFSIKNDRLKHYRNLVWDEIELFETFSIEFKSDTYRIEMIYRLKVPDNVNHWQVFNDDAQLK